MQVVIEAIKHEVKADGGEAKMKKIRLSIEGMHCMSCCKLIEGELEDNGISSKIDLKSKKAIIEFDPKNSSEEEIKSLIKNLNFKVK